MGVLARGVSPLVFLTVLGLAWADPAQGQNSTITGSVVDAGTLQPIASAQVFIPSLNTGALTREDGRYILVNVPPGTHTVQAQILGFRTASAQVTVGAGQTASADFRMQQDALALDAVIVTGTPGGTQRRAIGNVVSQVDAERITETQPVATIQQLMTGRTAGLDYQRQSGNVGQGSSIRIRGVSSLTLTAQPLIYVDGVRVDNTENAGPNVRGGAASSALDDFNPDDIASIEVIKGPAAATLYGTEASAGVIQIITKKGLSGAPQFNLTVNQGANFMIDPAGVIGDHHGCRVATRPCPADELYSFNIYENEKNVHGNEIFEPGYVQGYSLGVRGGTDAIRYYLSVDWDDQDGIVDYNWNKRLTGRANVGVLVTEGLNIDVSTGYTSGETSYLQQIEEGSIWENLQWAQGHLLETPLRGFLRYRPEDIATVSATRESGRFTGSVTVTHTPLSWLTQRMIVGLDRSSEESQVLVPRHPDGAQGPFQALSLGRVDLSRPLTSYASLDYSASAKYAVGSALNLTSSVGAQYYSSEVNRVDGQGTVFASPAIRSIEGATNKNIRQFFIPNKSLGFFVQQEVALNDRIYLTAAVRMDDNSAFGSEFDAAIYPKLSAAWVVSDEGFWGGMEGYVNSLRLRAALGQAGRQPPTFAAVTLYDPAVGPGGSAALTPGTQGNAEVGPEVSTELELGFDAAFLNDRLTAEATYFYQKIRDALADVPLSPSRGFSGSQDANLGQLDNRGWEVSANARLVERPNVAFDLGFVGAHVRNKIVDIGGIPETDDFREGLPYPIYVTDVLVSAELNEFGQAINQMCDSGTGIQGREVGGEPRPCTETRSKQLMLGTQYPQYTWSISPSLTLFDDLQIFAMANGEFASWNHSGTVRNRLQSYPSNDKTFLRDDPLYVASVMNRNPNDSRFSQVYDAAFWKLREVGARYQIPAELAQRFGMSSAALSVSGRNLWTIWQRTTHISGIKIDDPEVRAPERNVSSAATGQFPGISALTASLRVTF